MLGTRILPKGGVMIHWLGRSGRCVGANNHAIFCFPCGVCFGCVVRHLIVTLQLHLHFYHYIAVVTCCNNSFSSPIHLPCVHRSCGEPRPTLACLSSGFWSCEECNLYPVRDIEAVVDWFGAVMWGAIGMSN